MTTSPTRSPILPAGGNRAHDFGNGTGAGGHPASQGWERSRPWWGGREVHHWRSRVELAVQVSGDRVCVKKHRALHRVAGERRKRARRPASGTARRGASVLVRDVGPAGITCGDRAAPVRVGPPGRVTPSPGDGVAYADRRRGDVRLGPEPVVGEDGRGAASLRHAIRGEVPRPESSGSAPIVGMKSGAVKMLRRSSFELGWEDRKFRKGPVKPRRLALTPSGSTGSPPSTASRAGWDCAPTSTRH
jgi:hypothetical protein